MPKNLVVVFDELERLHTSQDNYLDLIRIINYLKTTNKCKIILICNMSELNKQEEQKQHIFNTYMERFVDEVVIVNKLKLVNLFSLGCNDEIHHEICNYIRSNVLIIKKVLKQCQKLYNDDNLNGVNCLI